ncbi:tetratricopeptide repeat protein [Thermomonas sp.]|jgi:predicted negative regulator of RcsB-dependent stress response|uniref:YfgM family protein n=1 Tax=Thermomonas sp. TaxID=1971895 RepID=UPI001B415C38|nr:tetratricopeptide repeat protein [Thermomonas sp.]MBP8177360.1 tetratricopeptide repeat protein [Xanthomonadales bacterium]MBK6332959.1 tetratricopeptide repeat protein [Thermomonas sp.]MBK6417491.1 tetratricopeptide repeat protein [Thermomonas sp.]MBK6924713.1 tetratricopeptide repeat protein [Thermomonas sp.]MBK7206410.1 tetratricopeptide repeat protein [Thermomonas sp.]
MAIDDLLDEHEQSERVRSWIRSNALGLVGGVALGLGAIAGWQWWQGQQLQRGMAVNARYAEVVRNYEAGRLPADKGRAALDTIAKGNQTLATLAALQLAKTQAEAGKRDDAIATLRGLHDLDPELRVVVRQRLARLLIDAGKGKDALSLLDDERNPAMLDARGDAQLALGDRAKAQSDYLKALALVDVADPQHRLLTLKLIEAGGMPPHTEDKT